MRTQELTDQSNEALLQATARIDILYTIGKDATLAGSPLHNATLVVGRNKLEWDRNDISFCRALSRCKNNGGSCHVYELGMGEDVRYIEDYTFLPACCDETHRADGVATETEKGIFRANRISTHLQDLRP